MVFSRPPYIKCPFCGDISFGINNIGDLYYTRRCCRCWRPSGSESSSKYPLPPPKKQVIYLDQFAISNMAKALLHDPAKSQNFRHMKFWVSLFDKINILCNGQLIVCPYSGSHMDESLLCEGHNELKIMYEALAHGIRFKPLHLIERMQLCNHATSWINGLTEIDLRFDRQSVIFGKIDAWQADYYFTFQRQWLIDSKEVKRKSKERISGKLGNIFARWQTEKNKSFWDWFDQESMGYGKAIFEESLGYIKTRRDISAAGRLPASDELTKPLVFDFFDDVLQIFMSSGLRDAALYEKIKDYFLSSELKNLPHNRISALLWAAIARKAASGQKRPMSKGMRADVQFISDLLPYCTAMFIDKECHGLLTEEPLAKEISRFGTRLFSLNNKEEFIEYLEGILANATPEHLAALEEVYGNSWRHPSPPEFTA